MSLAAAIGYVIGIIIFALFMRRYRRRLITRNMVEAEAKR